MRNSHAESAFHGRGFSLVPAKKETGEWGKKRGERHEKRGYGERGETHRQEILRGGIKINSVPRNVCGW